MYIKFIRIDSELNKVCAMINIDTINYNKRLRSCKIYTTSNKLYYLPISVEQYNEMILDIKDGKYFRLHGVEATDREIDSLYKVLDHARRCNSEEN